MKIRHIVDLWRSIALLALLMVAPCLIWSDVRIDFDRFHQLMEERFGSRRVRVSQAWERLLQDTAQLSDTEKADRVNRFFYQHLRYARDIDNWGQEDYWATPLETMGKGLGDCEDWAIAKYFSLRALGISDRHLRLIYVSARITYAGRTITEPHMVLGYYPDPADEPLILDNLIRQVRPASQRPDLTPVFSFNSEGLWVGLQQPGGAGASAPLSRWRDVLERVQEEGMKQF